MIGDRTIFFDSIDSTNKYIKENWERLPSESVVWAKTQKNGYGRKGNEWNSGSGGLWFSVLFKPKKRPTNPWHYVRLYSLGIYDIINNYTKNCKIKWPNDILVNDKKICGIIGEAVYRGKNPEAIIVGVGLNVNNNIPEELHHIATPLKDYAEKDISLKKLLNQINHTVYYGYFLKYMKDKSVSVISKKWLNALNIKTGDHVEVKHVSGEIEYGEIAQINPDYVEILDSSYNRKILYAGEISIKK